MSTYVSNSADIEDGSSKQLQPATFEEIAPEDEFSLEESSVGERACSSEISDIEDGDSKGQLLSTFEEILYQEIVYADESCPNESTIRKGTCSSNPSDIEDVSYKQQRLPLEDDSSTDYANLNPQEKDKLNAFLEEIVTKAGFDFSNPEIQDIQSALSEMIERIKSRINERRVFSISRLQPCGSMAEMTAMWKYGFWSEQLYIEFDFLAVLQTVCDIERYCQECFCVNKLPANSKLLKMYCRCERKDLLECFTRETNDCLASCGCLEVNYPDRITWWRYAFESSSTCSKTQQGCDKCTVDRPTGTLRVKTSAGIGDKTPSQCTLVFEWTSKANTLCTRDSRCLRKIDKMDHLTIHIDFLPALELFQSKQQSDVATCSSSDLVLNPTGSEYEHYCFLIPKHCAVCDKGRRKDIWRRSGCRAEIDTIVNKMSDKHRKCYKVLKHLTGLILYDFNNYLLKIAVLHHNSSCSDAGEDCAKCVIKGLDELQHAYETKQLKSFHSQANLLERMHSNDCNYYSEHIFRLKEAICSAVSESDLVSSFLEKVDNLYTFRLIYDPSTRK